MIPGVRLLVEVTTRGLLLTPCFRPSRPAAAASSQEVGNPKLQLGTRQEQPNDVAAIMSRQPNVGRRLLANDLALQRLVARMRFTGTSDGDGNARRRDE